MANNLGIEPKAIPDSRIFRRVLPGLHPTVAKLMVPPPTDLDDLFAKFEKLLPLIPADDDFWNSKADEHQPPEVTISPKPDEPTIKFNPGICYKCGICGHFSWQCEFKRNKAIQPKRTRRGKKKNKKDAKNSAKLRTINVRVGEGCVRKNLTYVNVNSVKKISNK